MCVYMLRSNVLIRSFDRVKFVESLCFFCFDDDDDDHFLLSYSLKFRSFGSLNEKKKVFFFGLTAMNRQHICFVLFSFCM